jgi:hypothetical protein
MVAALSVGVVVAVVMSVMVVPIMLLDTARHRWGSGWPKLVKIAERAHGGENAVHRRVAAAVSLEGLSSQRRVRGHQQHERHHLVQIGIAHLHEGVNLGHGIAVTALAQLDQHGVFREAVQVVSLALRGPGGHLLLQTGSTTLDAPRQLLYPQTALWRGQQGQHPALLEGLDVRATPLAALRPAARRGRWIRHLVHLLLSHLLLLVLHALLHDEYMRKVVHKGWDLRIECDALLLAEGCLPTQRCKKVSNRRVAHKMHYLLTRDLRACGIILHLADELSVPGEVFVDAVQTRHAEVRVVAQQHQNAALQFHYASRRRLTSGLKYELQLVFRLGHRHCGTRRIRTVTLLLESVS